jgi:hypothetical protein
VTDANGRYSFSAVDSGLYTIQATHALDRKKALIWKVYVAFDSTLLAPTGILRTPGTIKAMLPDSAGAKNGYIYVPGTTLVGYIQPGTGFAVLDSVPAGVQTDIYYGTEKGPSYGFRFNLTISAGDTVTTANGAWKYSSVFYLNTTASGAGIAGNVTDFPVLLRLTQANFDFSQAKTDGGDLRFTKVDGTPLSYEIERWDASSNVAEVWVKTDTVFGNNNSQYVIFYWGNPNAASASNGPAVFDTGSGFQGVWHMGQSQAPVPDATVNHFDGTPSDTAPAVVAGEIGMCRQFDGKSNYLHMPGTASGKLNFPAQGFYSVSAWVYADTLDTTYQKIIEKNNYQYKMQIDWEKNWSFGEYESAVGHDLTNAPATAKTWVYLVGVRSGSMQYFYLNGVCAANVISIVSFSIARDTTTDIVIGRSARPALDGAYFFKGRIDEARIENAPRSADWIKLCYMNQKNNDALIILK